MSISRAGGRFDDVTISLIAQLAYEQMIQHLDSDNLLFKGLKNTPRSITAVEAADQMARISIDKPVSTWGETLLNSDIQ